MNDNEAPYAPDDLSSLRILVIENLDDARVILCGLLGAMGVSHIDEATGIDDALRYLDGGADRINAVLCDWNMPSLDAIALFRYWRDIRPHTPFILIGPADDASRRAARDAGIAHYIRKPFVPDQLEARLRLIAAQPRR